jgi:hypothetical protein
MWAALGTNERFSAGKPTPVRLSTSNSVYTQRVKWMKEQDKWRDQHGKPVTEVTPEESIELRVKEITRKTKDTPISYQQERVVKVYGNDLSPLTRTARFPLVSNRTVWVVDLMLIGQTTDTASHPSIHGRVHANQT